MSVWLQRTVAFLVGPERTHLPVSRRPWPRRGPQAGRLNVGARRILDETVAVAKRMPVHELPDRHSSLARHLHFLNEQSASAGGHGSVLARDIDDRARLGISRRVVDRHATQNE